MKNTKIIKGKFNEAKIFTKNIDEIAIDQIQNYVNLDLSTGESIRIMPDTHAGKGSVIGFTQTFSDKIIPNIVGVDIACGMLTINLGDEELDLKRMDRIINQHVPHGFKVNKEVLSDFDFMTGLSEGVKNLIGDKVDRIQKSIGSLGGGNHFIEIAQDEDKNNYLVIHSGSRHFGVLVNRYHQNTAIDNMKKDEELKNTIPKDLAYLTGEYLEEYLSDVKIATKYAIKNRKTIANTILKHYFDMNIDDFPHFETIHNYVDLENNMIRKGAISAQKGEKVLIPLNMRDGSLIAIGKGNKDWNYSAPHGAGRILSRRRAFRTLNLQKFIKQMEGIYSSSVSRKTLDEAPMAYKDSD